MIISLSGKKRCGKTKITEYLIRNHAFIDISWAYPLKEIIGRDLFGLTTKQLYGSDEERERVIPEWGMSAREIWQKVGTHLFRNNFDSNFWVKLGMKALKTEINYCRENNVVFSDSRFPNELNALYNFASKKHIPYASVLIIREGHDTGDLHASETSLEDYPFDFTVSAESGDLKALYGQMKGIINAIRNK